jgi:predicted metalloendopeptidase
MSEMIENIQNAFFDIIDEIDWIGSDETRNKAKAKAEKMNTFIGYPEWLLKNATALAHHYNGVRICVNCRYQRNNIMLDLGFYL